MVSWNERRCREHGTLTLARSLQGTLVSRHVAWEAVVVSSVM
jgi:hypothetical protein